MNDTETKAREWLMASCGYRPEDIVFRSSISPDFILADGIGLEVKRVLGKTLSISEHQWSSLKRCEFCLIAIFDKSCSVPKALIPVAGLDPPAAWGEYTLKVHPDQINTAKDNWNRHLDALNKLKGKGLTREQFREEYQQIVKRFRELEVATETPPNEL